MDFTSSVDWARAQFGLTACFHFLFVPLTLGLSVLLAIMETLYFWKKDEFWKKATQFWMKLFAVNFAVGVATGIILEFEFGTNWSNYSWLVGDIFGAPLAIEGLFAFFLEATFFAVMFFGWDRVSPAYHLLSTWMVAIGSNLSALWILVANGWMQYPTGTTFNMDKFRNEMTNFFDVLFSPVAMSKFSHTVTSSFVVGALFVVGVSAWYLLKNRHSQEVLFAKKSLILGAWFGLLAALASAFSGDRSAYHVAHTQPVKLAAMEGLYRGSKGAGLTMMGLLNPNKKLGDGQSGYTFEITVPYLLSFLSFRDFQAFVPGLEDLVFGNSEQGIMGTEEKIRRGKLALGALKEYQVVKSALAQLRPQASYGDRGPLEAQVRSTEALFRSHEKYLGYAHLDHPEDIVPPVAAVAYSFHLMVALGSFFIALLGGLVLWTHRGWGDLFLKSRVGSGEGLVSLTFPTWLLWACVGSVPLGFLATQLGWIVAEVGRQPWVIQDLLLTKMGATEISAGSIQLTFFLFLVLFGFLFIADLGILWGQIRRGPHFDGAHKSMR